jgi:hypothetical protein
MVCLTSLSQSCCHFHRARACVTPTLPHRSCLTNLGVIRPIVQSSPSPLPHCQARGTLTSLAVVCPDRASNLPPPPLSTTCWEMGIPYSNILALPLGHGTLAAAARRRCGGRQRGTGWLYGGQQRRRAQVRAGG